MFYDKINSWRTDSTETLQVWALSSPQLCVNTIYPVIYEFASLFCQLVLYFKTTKLPTGLCYQL